MRDLTEPEVRDLYDYWRCPFCRSADFREGPSGGMSINIYCDSCGAGFNLMGPLRAGQLIREPGGERVSEGFLRPTRERLGPIMGLDEDPLGMTTRRRLLTWGVVGVCVWIGVLFWIVMKVGTG